MQRTYNGDKSSYPGDRCYRVADLWVRVAVAPHPERRGVRPAA